MLEIGTARRRPMGHEELSEAEAWEVERLKAAALEDTAGDGHADIFRLEKIAEEDAGEIDAGARQREERKEAGEKTAEEPAAAEREASRRKWSTPKIAMPRWGDYPGTMRFGN